LNHPEPVIRQAYRFALAPSPEQIPFLVSCCGASRFWFNQGLALVKRRLDERANGVAVDLPWSYKALCTAFRGATIKDELAPWRDQVVVGSYQAGLEALGSALHKFSIARRNGCSVGFPAFRSKGRCHESVIFQRPRVPDPRHVCLDKRLGPVKTKESMRKLRRLLAHDASARIVRATVKRGHGGWIVSFTVERSPKRRRARRPRSVVGVDLGVSKLATLSTGEVVPNGRPLQTAFKRVRRLERQVDRQRRMANPGNYLPDGQIRPGPKSWVASARMLRTQDHLRRIHRRAANVRREQAHQLTTLLAREFGIIGVETLSIRGMLRNARLARQIGDVGWGLILRQLRYKTAWSDGSILVAADRFYPSSKTCSACGAVRAKLRLSERVFQCDDPACGYSEDRDLNAAVNLAPSAALHAQARGVQCNVAATGAETLNACGGLMSLGSVEHGPVKREESPDSSQRGDALARAARSALGTSFGCERGKQPALQAQ
jgi:putative transposase